MEGATIEAESSKDTTAEVEQQEDAAERRGHGLRERGHRLVLKAIGGQGLGLTVAITGLRSIVKKDMIRSSWGWLQAGRRAFRQCGIEQRCGSWIPVGLAPTLGQRCDGAGGPSGRGQAGGARPVREGSGPAGLLVAAGRLGDRCGWVEKGKKARATAGSAAVRPGPAASGRQRRWRSGRWEPPEKKEKKKKNRVRSGGS